MILGKVKDVVRAGIGQDDIEPQLLQFFLESGLRRVEKQGNFYWMRDEVDFNLTIDDGEYTISAAPISVSNFKDARVLLAKDPDDTIFYEVPWGEKDQLDRTYASDDDGWPEAYTIDQDDILLIYPPDPDVAYNMRLMYYGWSSLPANNLSEAHELLKRFPEALIYAAIEFGIDWITHNNDLVAPWTAKFARELIDVKRQDHRRLQLDNLQLFPSRGPYLRRAVLKWRQW